MDKSLTKRLIIGAITALVIVYVIYLFVATNYQSTNIKTEIVTYMEVTDTIDTSGVIIRDEKTLSTDLGGVLVFEVNDGDKVTANDIIAYSYKDEEDAAATQKIDELDKKIEELKSLNKIPYSTNVGLDTVNSQMKNQLINFTNEIHNFDFSNLKDAESDLLYLINERQIITGTVSNFNSKIGEYEAQKAEIEQNINYSADAITTNNSGYFNSGLDGYENCYDYQKAEQITLEEFNKLKPSGQTQTEGQIGKIIENVFWYLVCPVTSEEAITLSHIDSEVSLNLPMASSQSIPASIASINQLSKKHDAVVVFKCDYMSSSLIKARNETVQISLGDYEGLRVSKKALHDGYIERTVKDENGNSVKEEVKVQGVYTLYGNKLVFREVKILYAGTDYVICDDEPDSKTLVGDESIALYDKIVVEGEDLYDGKVIK